MIRPLRFVILILGAAIAVVLILRRNLTAPDLPVLGQLSAFELTEASSSKITLDSLKGKINVIDFIFTHCEGPCPMMSAQFGRMVKEWEGDSRIQFVSVTVDPARDSPEALTEYGKRFGDRDDRWLFLTGPVDDISRLARNSLLLPNEGWPVAHSTRFVLVDQRAQIRGYYDSLDTKSLSSLKTHITRLKKNLP